MSTMVMSKCWPLQIPPTAKAVLISLADNANDQGVCWPSIATIAQRTCFSERAIQGAIKWLEECHLVKADRSNGRHTTYLITPDDFMEQTPAGDAPRSKCTPAGDAPRSKCTPAGDAPTPAAGASAPPQEMRQPPQQVPTNRKEPSIEPSGNRQLAPARGAEKFDPMKSLLALGVSSQVAKDWLAIRKAKRAPLTLTALEAVQTEAVKAGLTVPAAIQVACESGWQGFKASWLKPKQGGHRQPSTDRAAQNAAANAEAMALLGLNQTEEEIHE